MKHLPVLRASLFLLSAMLLITACKKDDDDDPAPSPTPAPTDARDVHVGTYVVTDSLWLAGVPYTPPFVNYVLSINKGGTVSDTLYFNNLWNDGASYYALLAGSFFSFPSQNVSGPYNMTGSGTFTGALLYYQTSGDVFVHHGYGTKQ
ncbi:MAG: hypothetical protein IPP83_17620 [Flavobacteriales bacterium]|nr:hypothetical protein [Flavobacteriales bacterium]